MTEYLGKCWKWVLGVVAVLAGLFFYERSQEISAKTELESVENKKDNEVTQEKVDAASVQLKDEEDKLLEESKKKPSDVELEDFLKKL